MTSANRSEARTRTELVDTQLAQAGWSKSRRSLVEEVLLRSAEPDGTYGNEQFADYVLLGSDGKPLAVVEAKRTSRDELAGKRQAADYADAIKARFGLDPFVFLTNGKEIKFWDRDRYPPRKVAGFYTCDDLERLRHQQRHAQALHEVSIDASIAGRDYQVEAIRRVTEGIDAAKRRFLLVMATGTGKTRTTIALVDTLLRAKRVQRVLFLADRRELVRQAMSEFKTHLPNESLARIEGGDTTGARIQFSTYPSMMQVYQRLSVGYYDLIVADESHRSIYQRYKALFDHFDAIQLGLTATPTDYIDHNTFALFDCGDGTPSYYYSYEQAIADQNLVNYRVLDAQTNFQLKGIQGDALPEAALLAWGQTVTALAAQFQPNPPAWPAQEPNIPPAAWRAFKELMEAFYEKGLQAGLPYTADGTPVIQGGVTYADFVRALRDAHRLNPDPNAREVCVLCGGPLGAAPEVDHWIAKHAFPLLSVCADNLLPICGDCNATSNKGRKPVHDHGSFQDWFHPYFRPGAEAIRLDYRLPEFAVTCTAMTPADATRVRNLDGLLNLSLRWTRELKMEYAKQQGKLKRYEAQRLSRGQARHTQAEVEAFAASFRDGLLESEPNHEVHRLLGDVLLEQARLAAWQTELGLVT